MVKGTKTRRYKILGSIKGSGTTYSCLYSTVKDRGKELALAKRLRTRKR